MKAQTGIADKLHEDDDELAALMRPMLKKPLFVILSSGGSQKELIGRHLVEHLHYMIDLERKGVLFASGPFVAADDVRPGDGLTIIRAENIAAAKAIAEQDPFIRYGARTFAVKAWIVNEGSLSLKVNLSDQTIFVA